MATKTVGGGQGGRKSPGKGKGAHGPRQPLDRKEGRAGARRSFGGERGRFKPLDKEKRGPVRGRGQEAKPRPRPEERPPAVRGAQAGAIPARQSVPQGLEEKVMGINPVMELLKSGGRPVDALYIDREKGGKLFRDIIALARQSGVKLVVAPKEALDKMSGGLRHQGALATVAAKQYADFHGLSVRMREGGGLPLLVILDGIEDPQNLGSIIRTAESAGVDMVVVPQHRAAHMTASVARASSGALEHVPVARVSNLVEAITYLKKKGFWVLGLEGGAGADYTGFDMNVPLAVVIGGEGKGVRPVIKKACDAVASLPMFGKVNSLNASVAAGVVLYEALRQRGIKIGDIRSK